MKTAAVPVPAAETLRTASVRELRSHVSEMIEGPQTVLVTKHGKATAMVFPLSNPKEIPLELRRQLYLALSAKIAQVLDAKGISEEEVLRDFEDAKKRRRRR